ncbi:MAG: PAS domain-containing protein, partial [Methanobacteriaceae archaeon]|nr:PAS domain-containing protein [Methanobacteriaceae archaeon]
YGINIFQFTEEFNEPIAIYSNDTFWDYFIPDYHKNIKGRLFNEILPLIKKFYSLESLKNNNNSKTEALIKLYENGRLIKVWSQTNTLQGDLFYNCNKDLTDYYLEKEKRETIFYNSENPIFNIDKNFHVIKINKALKVFLGYSLKDFENINYNKIVHTNEFKDNKNLTICEILDEIFKEKILSKNLQLILITKDNIEKIVKAHLTLVQDEYVQISIFDKSELIESQKNSLRIQNYLNEIQDVNKSAINLFMEDKYYWTDKIFDLLEIAPSERVYTSPNFFIKDYVNSRNQKIIDENFKKLTLSNPIEFEFDLLTPKGNQKYFRTYSKLVKQDDKLVRIVITQDITHEKLEKLEKLRLNNSFEAVASSSNIVLAESDGANYYFTKEIYNWLEIDPEDYEGVDVIQEFAFPEDKKLLKQIWKDASEENNFYELKFRAKSSTGKILYLEINAKFIFEDGKLITSSAFLQNITEKTLSKNKALRLQESINTLGDFSKIIIGSYENGKINWTSEIYNILKINPTDYDDTVNVLRLFSDSKDLEIVDNALKNLSPENNTFSHVSHVYDIEGNIHYFNSYTVANFDDNGENISHDFFIQDLTDEILAKEKALRLQESINTIGEFSKIAIGSYENGHFNWTPEVYNILKINPEDYDSGESLMGIFSATGDVKEVKRLIENTTPENNSFYHLSKVYDSEGNLHYINSYTVMNFDENNEKIGDDFFIQDVTDEILARDEALRLQESINTIGEFSKIAIGSYENGHFNWTPEVYNILKINPEDYDNNINLFNLFSTSKDIKEVNQLIDNLSPKNNNFSHLSKVYDKEGELHYINLYTIANFDENDKIISEDFFIQDVTEETIAKEANVDLQSSLNTIQDISKIVVCNYKNDVYNWTPEIYNILEINPKDYDKHSDLIKNFIIETEDKYDNLLDSDFTPENDSIHAQIKIKTSNGKIKFFNNFIKARFTKEGDLIDIIGFLQ